MTSLTLLIALTTTALGQKMEPINEGNIVFVHWWGGKGLTAPDGRTGIPAAVDELYFRDFDKSFDIGDVPGFLRMVRDKKADLIPAGSRVLVRRFVRGTTPGILTGVEVSLLDGPKAGEIRVLRHDSLTLNPRRAVPPKPKAKAKPKVKAQAPAKGEG